MTFFDAIILGLVEGITEFLPISSTGHLILASDLLGLGGEEAGSFIDAIQAGAILAVLALYPARFKGLFQLKGRGFKGGRAFVCLALSTLPAALLALVFEKAIKEKLFAPLPVALAMAVGAVWIFMADQGQTQGDEIDDMGPAQAFKIGLWQCLALWPGMSRSACSILGGMRCGLSRKAAVEYSFFAASPLLFAAFGYELLKHADRIAPLPFALGFATAFVSAFLAVKLFVGWVSKNGLRPFAWYRLAAAILVWSFLT